MSWMMIAVGLAAAFVLRAGLLSARPRRPDADRPRSLTNVLALLAIVCTAPTWHASDRMWFDALAMRGATDRNAVRLKREIEAARDMACETPYPTTPQPGLLTAYVRMRTTCAYYVMVSMEAGRASDLAGVLAAAEKPWPAGGSPRVQLWTYEPLKSDADDLETLMRPQTTAAQIEKPFGEALAVVVAALLRHLTVRRDPDVAV